MIDGFHLVLTPVREERAQEFERFVSDVITPAVAAQRPDLVDRWHVLRSEGATGGVVTYAVVLQGGSLDDDWDLDVLLPAHLGQEEADRVLAEWSQTLAELRPWADAAVETGHLSNQLVWTLVPMSS